jgi:ferredoxin-NADP reductase
MVATRLRDSAFKRTLAALAPGALVHIEGPFGDMVLHNNPRRPAVLLAGGIGITPFRSMVVRAAKEKLPHRIFLFFSNRSPEDAPFLDELRTLESENPNYRFIPTMTGTEGHLVAATLTRHLAGIDSPLYYLAGPAAMVGGMRALLNTSGVDDDDIRAEEFSGY